MDCEYIVKTNDFTPKCVIIKDISGCIYDIV